MNILQIKHTTTTTFTATATTLLRRAIQPQCCACAVRHIMRKPVTKLPNSSSKGTKMKKYVVPPHRVGVIKGWDSKHTGLQQKYASCNSVQKKKTQLFVNFLEIKAVFFHL